MRFTNSILATILTLLLLSLASGCSKDDDSLVGPESGSIIGTWDLTGMTSQMAGQTYIVPAAEIVADPLRYAFFDDNTGVQYYQEQETVLDWSISGETLTTTAPWGETQSYKYSVTSTTLNLQFLSDGFTVTHIFTRR